MLPNDHFILYYSTYLTHYVIISLPEPKDKSDGFFGLLLVSVKFSHFHLNSSPEPLKSVSTRLGTNSKREFVSSNKGPCPNQRGDKSEILVVKFQC